MNYLKVVTCSLLLVLLTSSASSTILEPYSISTPSLPGSHRGHDGDFIAFPGSPGHQYSPEDYKSVTQLHSLVNSVGGYLPPDYTDNKPRNARPCEQTQTVTFWVEKEVPVPNLRYATAVESMAYSVTEEVYTTVTSTGVVTNYRTQTSVIPKEVIQYYVSTDVVVIPGVTRETTSTRYLTTVMTLHSTNTFYVTEQIYETGVVTRSLTETDSQVSVKYITSTVKSHLPKSTRTSTATYTSYTTSFSYLQPFTQTSVIFTPVVATKTDVKYLNQEVRSVTETQESTTTITDPIFVTKTITTTSFLDFNPPTTEYSQVVVTQTETFTDTEVVHQHETMTMSTDVTNTVTTTMYMTEYNMRTVDPAPIMVTRTTTTFYDDIQARNAKRSTTYVTNYVKQTCTL